jgi:PST family polysaccharide transporter
MLAALIHRRDRVEEATHTAFLATASAGVALTLAALAASPLVGLLFSSEQVGLVAAAMSGMLFLGALTVVPDALLQRRFSFLRRVIVDPIGVAVFGVASIAALASGLGVWGLVLATYLSQAAQVVTAWKASGFRPQLRGGSFRVWRELAGYGRFVLAGTTIDHAAIAANTFALGRFLSTSALGQYRYASRFGVLPQELSVNAASYVLLPAYSRISHEHDRFQRAFERSLRVLLAVITPGSLLLVPLGLPLMVVLLGEEWRPAGYALTALCIASAPSAAGSIAASALKAGGRPNALPRLHFVEAVMSIGLMLAFLPLGLTGAAFGFALGLVVGNVYAVARTARVLDFDLKRIARLAWAPYLGAAVMIAVVLPLEHFVIHAEGRSFVVGLVLIALEAALGLVVYFACLLVVAPVTALEIELAARLVNLRRERQPAARRVPRAPAVATSHDVLLFSVVMPAHNTAATIGAAIESVLAQSREDFEVLVVDDGSEDGTADAVDRYASDPRVRLLRRPESGGPGAARNTAFAVAHTPLVCMLDSDDLWLPHYLETAAEALAAHPSAALFCAGNWTLEEPPGLIRRNTSKHADAVLDADEFLLRLMERNFVVNSTVTVRREALLECGGCDPSLRAAVDLDLWLRLAATGHGAIRVAEPLAVYRLRSGSIQHDRRNELHALRGLRSVYAARAEVTDFPAPVQKVTSDRLDEIDRRIARLSDGSPVPRTMRRLRQLAGVSRDVLLRRQIWYADVPSELAEALPVSWARDGAHA